MNFLTFSGVEYIDKVFRKVLNTVDSNCKIFNINMTNFGQLSLYPQKNDKYHDIQIKNDSLKYNIWKDPLTPSEQHNVLSLIYDKLESLTQQYQFAAALVPDDYGCFNKLFILFCNIKKIPVIYWVHGVNLGSSFNCNKKQNFFPDSRSECITEAEKIFPRGLNGCYAICVNSIIDKFVLVSMGVLPHQIFITGNPMYDDYNIFLQKPIPKIIRKPKYNILYISTGYSKFNMLEEAKLTYNFLENIIQYIDISKYNLAIRLKPGEDPCYIKNICPSILRKDIQFTDNSIELIEQIKQFDAVLVDKSTAGIKTALYNIPTIILKIPGIAPVYTYSPIDMLALLYIDTPNNINYVLEISLTEKYLELMQREIKKNEETLFYSLDGNSHIRIAKIIIDIINNTKNSDFLNDLNFSLYRENKLFSVYKDKNNIQNNIKIKKQIKNFIHRVLLKTQKRNSK